MKRTYDPKYERFAHLPNRCQPGIYIAEMSNGWVKVGWTATPFERMKCLCRDMKREHGAEILRFDINLGVGGKEKEDALISAMEQHGFKRAHKVEYFSAPFDAALKVFHSLLGVAQ